jgi:methyl-accepting chemotaxis protein
VAIKEIGATIGHISEIAATIATAVGEQGTATQQIARNVQSAATGTTDAAGCITDVAKGSSETGTASNLLLTSAQGLSGEGSRLKREVEKFLHSVRAA